MLAHGKPFFVVIERAFWEVPGSSDGKVSAYNAGNPGSIPGSEDPLEKEMATHSSILAWKIPWTEEPGRLQSMGSQSQTQLSDFTSLRANTYKWTWHFSVWVVLFSASTGCAAVLGALRICSQVSPLAQSWRVCAGLQKCVHGHLLNLLSAWSPPWRVECMISVCLFTCFQKKLYSSDFHMTNFGRVLSACLC